MGTLYGTADTAALSLGVRLHAGVAVWRALARTQPFVELRGELLARDLMGQEWLTDGTSLLIHAPGDDLQWAPVLAATVGVEHRFGARVQAALRVDLATAGDLSRHAAVTFDLTWTSY